MYAQTKLILAGKYEKFCEKFCEQSDFEYRIKTSIEILNDLIPLDVECECKNSGTSKVLRQKADQLFLEHKESTDGLLCVWELYSKSAAYAENNSQELPLAYANRSAILYHLRKYEDCIRDIDTALQLNYPDSLRANLIRRKAKCLKLLGNPEADDVCEEARRCMENMQLSDKYKKDLKRKIQYTEVTKKLTAMSNTRKALPDIVKNKKIPCASDAVDIKYDEKCQRHLVATRDIRVGEVLVIERPYALLLNPDHIYSHCSHCFARAWSSIACPNCVHAMYCSESCRNEAWNLYHDIECPIKGYFFDMKMNDLAPFSLRLAVLVIREAGGIEKLEEELKDIEKCEDPLEKPLSDGVYRSDIYRAFQCLETHKNERMWSELVSILLTTAIITYYTYTSTSFFEENSEKSIEKLLENEKVIFVAKLIAHHYMALQINDHGFSEIDLAGQNHNIGAVIYAFSSLFNHSCNPNVTRVPVMEGGKKPLQMIFALHPIKEGSQIFDDYGFDFAVEPISNRKNRCFPYHFSCECEACKDDWPLYENLKSIFSKSLSEDKKVELKELIHKFNFYKKTVLNADFQFLDSESELILPRLAEFVTILFSYSLHPNAEFYESMMLFRHVFLLVYGNRIEF